MSLHTYVDYFTDCIGTKKIDSSYHVLSFTVSDCLDVAYKSGPQTVAPSVVH